MLTHTDVHLLVGVLSSITSPDDVEVELGSRVADEASRTARDVDVTITARHPDGSVAAYAALEVKDESQPLDTPTVEQLIAKLRDMPSITHRSIVSSSGYTAPAKSKAAHHGVELLTLREWRRGERIYPFLNPDFRASVEINLFHWVRTPKVVALTDLEQDVPIPRSTLVIAHDGSLTTTLGQLADAAAEKELNLISLRGMFDDLANGVHRSIQRQPRFEQPWRASLASEYVRIVGFDIKGDVIAKRTRETPVMKLLVHEATGQPHAACLVGIMPTKDLCGAVFTSENPNPHLVRIPVSDRNLKVLNRIKLPRCTSFSCYL
jgi:hypothetical protein